MSKMDESYRENGEDDSNNGVIVSSTENLDNDISNAGVV